MLKFNSVLNCSSAGEIIPQALCKSYALPIGNYAAPMVRVLCYGVGIISWPVSKLLDWVLGNEHTVRHAWICPCCPEKLAKYGFSKMADFGQTLIRWV